MNKILTVAFIALMFSVITGAQDVASPQYADAKSYDNVFAEDSLNKIKADSIDAYKDKVLSVKFDEYDSIKPKTVTVSSPEIDSLQAAIDLLSLKLSGTKHFKDLLGYDAVEGAKYFRFLIKNNLETRKSISDAMETFLCIKELEIKQVQAGYLLVVGMRRTALFAHCKHLQDQKGKLLDIQLSLAAKDVEKPSFASNEKSRLYRKLMTDK
jgi:hypothetical protein